MSDLYLILHKVRGEPAFDIAQRLTIGDEEGWIIPTSGHRAYPIDSIPLQGTYVKLFQPKSLGSTESLPISVEKWAEGHPIPDDWPDHYNTHATKGPSAILTNVSTLLAKLGLGPPPIKRRKI